MYINTVSLPNLSRYGDISIYCCISNSGLEKKITALILNISMIIKFLVLLSLEISYYSEIILISFVILLFKIVPA